MFGLIQSAPAVTVLGTITVIKVFGFALVLIHDYPTVGSDTRVRGVVSLTVVDVWQPFTSRNA